MTAAETAPAVVTTATAGLDRPLLFGVDYYPEHWPAELLDSDLARIRALGCNLIRVGEFAWHLMEPEEGKYDFSYWDHVIERAKAHGLLVMFGTPTATFPAWLAHKHPEVLSVSIDGQTRVFGGRRQYSFNSRVYQEYATKLVERLVSHYADEPAIIAWQVDNEWGHEGSDDDYSPASHADFRAFLAQKYANIDELNEVWGTIFWGQTYNDWDEIPMPMHTITTHNPGLKLDWARHRSHSVNSFSDQQVAVIRAHKGAHQSVNHNYAGGWFIKLFDHAENAQILDEVAYNNYPVWGGLKEPREPAEVAYTLDFIRGLRQENFWITEQIMGAQGHDVIGYLPRPDQAKMWGYQAFAHGCQNMLWFRWRSMTRGAEQYCFGIIDHDDQAHRKYDEVQRSIAELSEYPQVFNSPIAAEVAVLYDVDNVWSWRAQPQSSTFDFVAELVRLYRPFYRHNLHIDVVPTTRDFSAYKVLVIPVLQIIDEALAARLREFAEGGGSIVFSFRAGTKDRDNNMHFGIPLPGLVADICGITIEVVESLQIDQTVPIAGTGAYEGLAGTCDVWRDLVIQGSAEVLFRYDDPSYRDRAVITRNRVGAGQVIYVAGGLDADVLDRVVTDLVGELGLPGIETPEGLEWYSRSGPDGEVVVALNHTDQVISYEGVELAPYESRIIAR
ncbi:MAG: beta-galactosidase [Candidatus Nanopelagicales bacterium]